MATRWHRTPGWWRALAIAASGCLAAVLLRRPDLVVLVGPLALAAALDWGRPVARPRLDTHAPSVIREGDPLDVQHRLHDGPTEGLVLASFERGDLDVAVVRATREQPSIERLHLPWGEHVVSAAHAHVITSWGGWVAGASARQTSVRVLPRRDVPALRSLPPPVGLGPGPHAGHRGGSGTDFAGLRPLRDDEPARRLHWAASLRTGRLVAHETHQDTTGAYLVLVDAEGSRHVHDDVVRTASGLCTRLTEDGAYAALSVLGCGDVAPVRLGAGPRHLHRLELALSSAAARPGSPVNDHQHRRTARLHLPVGTVVIAFSALHDPQTVSLLGRMNAARRRVTVIDTSAPEHDPLAALEHRVRSLHLEARGVPVTAWTTASASIDAALRRRHHRVTR